MRALPLLGLLAFSLGANATPPEHYLDYSLDELMGLEIASATKRPETVADIPASVTVITRRDLERMGWPTLEAVLRNVPGLYLVDNYGDMLIGVRGGINGGIQFLVNGVPRHPTRFKGLTAPDLPRFNIPVQSIDRIEVVRGPMSVIYGNNAFLGTVNIVTNQAESAPNLASVSYGSNDGRQAFLRLRNEWDAGFVVFNAGYEADGGVEGRYADLMAPEQLANFDPRMHTDLKGDLDHENYSLDLSANYRDFNLDLQYGRMDYGGYFLTPSFDDGTRVRLDSLHAALGYDGAIGEGLQLASRLIYSSESVDVTYDFIVPHSGGSQTQGSDRLDFEAELDWSPAEGLNLLGGYRHRRLFNIRNHPRVAVIGVVENRDSQDISRDDLFVQADYRPIHVLKLVAGVRWSHTDSYQVTSTRLLDGQATRWDFPSYSSWTPRVGAIWSLDERNLLKLLYGEALQDNQEIQFAEPEEIATWELNYLNRFDRGSLSLSLFQNRTDRLLRATQYLNPATGLYEKRVDNSGRLETRGVELIARLQPLRGLDWSLSATWQETTDLEHRDIAPGYSPNWLLKSQLSYRRAAWSGGLSLSYVDSMESDWQWVTESEPGVWERIGEPVDAYLLVDANLRYDFPGRGPYASLHLANLLDDEVRYPANQHVNFRYGAPGPGRSVLLTLGWKF